MPFEALDELTWTLPGSSKIAGRSKEFDPESSSKETHAGSSPAAFIKMRV
jgi:hypothetical protein